MKKFRFSLEKVLEIKEVEEKVIQKKLLLIQNEIIETEKKIISNREKISVERKKISLLSENIINSMEIMIHYKYIDGLTSEIESLQENLKRLKLQEFQIKKELIEKSKEKKALEKLKEIKFEEFKKDYNRAQQMFIDDISIQSHRFKVGSV